MKRKIVVIGMDNTGKTTLVNDMKKILKVESIKSPGPNFTRQEMYDKVNEDLMISGLVILERFSIVEELVYGKILRNNPKFSFRDLLHINETYHPIFIYCRPRKKDVLNFGDREQMEGVIENSKKLLEGFDDLYNEMLKEDFDIIRYDYNVSTPNEMVLKYKRSDKNEHYTC